MARRLFPIEKVAKIKTADLPIKHGRKEPKEHYVYVREYDREKKVYRVNICTSLETESGENNREHIQQVKYGNTYPVPIFSANFPRWTGIKREVYEVPKGKMYGWNCVRFKKMHKREKNDSFYSPSSPKRR